MPSYPSAVTFSFTSPQALSKPFLCIVC